MIFTTRSARSGRPPQEVGTKLGISPHTMRGWLKQARRDAGTEAGATTDELEERRRLRRENRELRRANEILKTASAFFAAELDRPSPK
ncbi:transposase [Brevibacterium ravenspurgense]|uniref:transposase n=1 Tax=Brevibacterium ravenspurgense TaxID=479117 RepID=UPI0009EDCAA5